MVRQVHDGEVNRARPCGSFGYTTSSVGTFTYSFSARYSIRLCPGGQRSSFPPTWISVGVVTFPMPYVGDVFL